MFRHQKKVSACKILPKDINFLSPVKCWWIFFVSAVHLIYCQRKARRQNHCWSIHMHASIDVRDEPQKRVKEQGRLNKSQLANLRSSFWQISSNETIVECNRRHSPLQLVCSCLPKYDGYWIKETTKFTTGASKQCMKSGPRNFPSLEGIVGKKLHLNKRPSFRKH